MNKENRLEAVHKPLQALLDQTALRLLSKLTDHPRRLTAIMLVILAGATATAFGVAPLADNESVPVQQLITEAIEVPELPARLENLEWSSLQLWRSDLTRSSDTADSLLKRLGVDDASAAAYLRTDPVARSLLEGRAGKIVQVVTVNNRLQRLIARYASEDPALRETHFTRLTIERDPMGLRSRTEQAELEAQTKLASGTIESSLFASADNAGVPDAITIQLAELFSTEIDFRRELRRGDSYSVAYEALTADGEPITWGGTVGRVIAARFVNDGKTHEAIWYEDSSHRGGYFDAKGRSKKRTFLASPLAFSRVTSGFKMRFHPIFKQWRAHLGVDYSAPTGTPVRVVGDGVVELAGLQNGYGKVVHVRHGVNRLTVYAHLSRINVKRGQRVEQGQVIGAVGATGWATGPHLHFEFRVGGAQIDPRTVARNSETTVLSAGSLTQFRQVAEVARGQLDAAKSLSINTAQAE